MTVPWYLEACRLSGFRRLTAPRSVRPELEALLQDGFTVVKAALSENECDRIVSSFYDIARRYPQIFERQRDANGHYPRMVNIQALFPEMLDAFTRNPKAQTICDYMFGKESIAYTTLYYESGSQQDVHRDTPYFWTQPGWRYFGVWTALETADEANGALMVVRGGHRLPEPDRRAIRERFFPNGAAVEPFSMETWSAYQDEVQGACNRAGLSAETVSVAKGDTIIWHPCLPHGGAPITDPRRTRHSLVTHVIPIDTPVRGQTAFFDPDTPQSASANWSYRERNDRRYVAFDTMSFAHREEITRQDLTAPV